MKYNTKSVAIYDLGLFTELAVTLSKRFGKVFYHTPWVSPFPKSNQMLIGDGIPGVERVNKFWDIIPDTDLFVFPDVGVPDIQMHLISLGKRVWGSRNGEELEQYRDRAKEHLSALGLPVAPWVKIRSFAKLREYLKTRKNKWVKVNITRGDMESFYVENYKLIEPRLDELEWTLGAKKYNMEFIVEDNIDNSYDLAFDGYCVDGQFPKKSMIGVEEKGLGYIGVFKEEKDYPDSVKEFNKKISSTMKRYGYRNFMSPEMRAVSSKLAYMNDMCGRCGSPPTELLLNKYKNIDDIIWKGAEGICVDPTSDDEFGLQLVMHSAWADKNWLGIEFPYEERDNVKLRNFTIIKNKYYIIPQPLGVSTIGALVSTGKTFSEAFKKLEKLVPKIKGHTIDVSMDPIYEAKKNVEKLASVGIKL